MPDIPSSATPFKCVAEASPKAECSTADGLASPPNDREPDVDAVLLLRARSARGDWTGASTNPENTIYQYMRYKIRLYMPVGWFKPYCSAT